MAPAANHAVASDAISTPTSGTCGPVSVVVSEMSCLSGEEQTWGVFAGWRKG